MAVQLLDDLSATTVRDADVWIRGSRRRAVGKEDGFYVFTDLEPGPYELTIDSARYQPFEHSFELPLPTAHRLILDVPGENERMLVVQGVDAAASTISFAARNFLHPLPAGTPVISSRLVTTLTAELEGEAVDTATLTSVGAGVTALRSEDVVRLVKQRVVRMRPGPYYPFSSTLTRLTGTVRDAATGQSIRGATLELTRINAEDVLSAEVGTSPGNSVRVYTVGSGAAMRALGPRRTVRSTTDQRGRYSFYFPARRDLTVDNVTVGVTATGYVAAAPVDVSLADRPDHRRSFDLTRS